MGLGQISLISLSLSLLLSCSHPIFVSLTSCLPSQPHLSLSLSIYHLLLTSIQFRFKKLYWHEKAIHFFKVSDANVITGENNRSSYFATEHGKTFLITVC
jgi:hypothetical protein